LTAWACGEPRVSSPSPNAASPSSQQQDWTAKDIAAALFVSRRTVESTLTRVYQKLAIFSRAELGARMTTE
jgi:hypothetical protein